MKKDALKKLSVDQLVERFVALALAQEQAEDDSTKSTRLYWQMDDVREELKVRPDDQRRRLVALFDHPNAQVRLKAAKSTLAIAPTAARRVLQALADSQIFPQAGDAGMCLWTLDEGIFKPT